MWSKERTKRRYIYSFIMSSILKPQEAQLHLLPWAADPKDHQALPGLLLQLFARLATPDFHHPAPTGRAGGGWLNLLRLYFDGLGGLWRLTS